MRAGHSQSPDLQTTRNLNGSDKPSQPNSTNTHATSSAGPSTNGHSARPSGSYLGHDREQVTRILIQALSDLGYHAAAKTLTTESAYELEDNSVAAFRDAIQQGRWLDAERLLVGTRPQDGQAPRTSSISSSSEPTDPDRPFHGLPLAEGSNTQELLFLVRRQKFLELLEKRNLAAALLVLRRELTPLRQSPDRLHALSRLIMSKSVQDLKFQALWDGAEGDSRQLLLSELSKSIAPSVMIPEHRLAILFDQVQNERIESCVYHNTVRQPSLYHDHVCDVDDFPLHCLTELSDHCDEVWYLDFSHDGSMLATGSKNNTIMVYDTLRWQLLQRLHHPDHGYGGREGGICYLSWSPDDRFLISCSKGYNLMVYDIRRDGELTSRFDTPECAITSAQWLPDGTTFVMASQDNAQALGIYGVRSPKPIFSWSKPGDRMRVNDCSVSSQGDRLAVVTNKGNRVITYDLASRAQLSTWTMPDQLKSVVYSKDGTALLISMRNHGPVLVDAQSGEILQTYRGAIHRDAVIRSVFGGAGENFVISGSEDSLIYIWRRQTGTQIAMLDGHAGGTNAVSWHPKNPAMFASAGDDMHIKIWANREAVRQARQSGLETSNEDGLDE